MPQPLRSVVAGIASLDAGDPAIHFGVGLAERVGATLHVVHAFSPPQDLTLPPGGTALDPIATAWTPVLDPAVWDNYRGDLEQRLSTLVREVAPEERVVPRVISGSASDVLIRVADEVSAELILVGPTRHGKVGQVFLGTTAGRLLRHAHAPVLVVRHPAVPAAGARVLLTTDLSELSTRAYQAGVETVHRLSAAGDPPVLRCLLVAGYDPALVPPPDRAEMIESASTALREFVARNTPVGMSVEGVVRLGDPTEEIVTELREWGADLVVLGTHGRSGLPHLLLGSVAEAVAREAPCSALVIPPPGRGSGT